MNPFFIALSITIAVFLLAGFIVAVGWYKILPEDIPVAVEEEAIDDGNMGLD